METPPDEIRKNIATLTNTYTALRAEKNAFVGHGVAISGSFPDAAISAELAELKKLILMHCRLLGTPHYQNGGTTIRVLPAGTTIKIEGVVVTLDEDTPVTSIRGTWEIVKVAEV